MKSILNEIQLLTDIVLEEDIALTFFPVKKCAPKQMTVQRALGIPPGLWDLHWGPKPGPFKGDLIWCRSSVSFQQVKDFNLEHQIGFYTPQKVKVRLPKTSHFSYF